MQEVWHLPSDREGEIMQISNEVKQAARDIKAAYATEEEVAIRIQQATNKINAELLEYVCHAPVCRMLAGPCECGLAQLLEKLK